MPLNSFDQNMVRNADLRTKNTQHYSCKKKPQTKVTEKLTRQVRFCKLKSLSILPLERADFPHSGNIFISPTEALETCSPVKKANPRNPIQFILRTIKFC